MLDYCAGTPDDWLQTLYLGRALLHESEFKQAEVYLVCPDDSGLAKAASNSGLGLLEIDPSASPRTIAKRLTRDLRFHPGVGLLHSFDSRALQTAMYLNRRSCRRGSYKIVHSLREAGVFNKSPLTLNAADIVVAAGSRLYSMAMQAGVTEDKLRVVPLVYAAKANRSCKRSPKRQGRFVFSSFGSLGQGKNYRCLLEAMACLHGMGLELPPWEVRIIGEGAHFDVLLDLAAKFDILPQLAMLGAQERLPLLLDSDVIISLESGLSDSITILEAWSAQVPVICTLVPDHQELAPKFDAVLAFDSGNPAALAGAMLKTMTDTTIVARLKQRGLARAAENSPEMAAGAYCRIYASLLAGRSASV